MWKVSKQSPQSCVYLQEGQSTCTGRLLCPPVFHGTPLVGPRATRGCTECLSLSPEEVLDLQFLQLSIHPSPASKILSFCMSSNTPWRQEGDQYQPAMANDEAFVGFHYHVSYCCKLNWIYLYQNKAGALTLGAPITPAAGLGQLLEPKEMAQTKVCSCSSHMLFGLRTSC